METLKKKGMVNDLEFARAWVEARRSSKQKGIRVLKAELYQKGIDKEIIEEVVLPFGGPQSLASRSGSVISEEELAQKALEKKMRIWKSLKPRSLRQKAIEFLLRKGFEYDVVKEVVEKIMKKE